MDNFYIYKIYNEGMEFYIAKKYTYNRIQKSETINIRCIESGKIIETSVNKYLNAKSFGMCENCINKYKTRTNLKAIQRIAVQQLINNKISKDICDIICKYLESRVIVIREDIHNKDSEIIYSNTYENSIKFIAQCITFDKHYIKRLSNCRYYYYIDVIPDKVKRYGVYYTFYIDIYKNKKYTNKYDLEYAIYEMKCMKNNDYNIIVYDFDKSETTQTFKYNNNKIIISERF